MEWLIVAGAILAVFVVFGTMAENRKKKKEAEKSSEYSANIEAMKQEFLTDTGTVSIPILNAASFGYRPVGKENLFAVQNAVSRLELRSAGRPGEKALVATASGRLLVTDKAVIFEGDMKNERVAWTQIADVELLLDGFTVSKRSGPPRTYQVAWPDPKFAAVVEIMLNGTFH